MAITITTLNGTDSVSSSRITINDNFTTILSALNNVLNIIDISTGKITNSSYGTSNNIQTADITVTGVNGITLNSGSVTLNTGNIAITNGKITLGTLSIERVNKTATGYATLPTLNFSGTSATGGTGTSGYLTIPRLTTAVLQSIPTPAIGSIVFDTTTSKLCVCTASGATGTWTAVH